MPPDLERLANYARSRGFRRTVAAAIFLIGSIPAALLIVLRPPTSGDVLLVALMLVFVPTALLLLWTTRDSEGQAGRELTMWLNSVRRATTDDEAPARLPFDELPDVPPDNELDRIRLSETALEYRETFGPMAAAPALGARIAVYRYWYVVLALVLTVLLSIGLFFVFRPSA